VILRLIDVQLAVPFVILALVIATSFEPSIIVLVCILGIVSWVNFAKMTRGVALVEVNKDYVKAAYVAGCSKPKIALKYVFPNIFPNLLPVILLQFAALIMLEATLSYLGVGLRPPTPSWGGMMLEGQAYMRIAWWVTVMPGIALFFTALGLNLMSEGLRKVVDPRAIR
jgi:peptide/nickel transport system permease protein